MSQSETVQLDQYQLNAVADIPDFRDLIYQPALVRLKPYLRRPPNLIILDQGSEGACTGFGLAAVINLLNQQRGRRDLVSPRMLYEMAKRHDEWPGERYPGSSCRGAIRGWYAMGVCDERDWPYRPNPGELTIKRAKQARENTLGAYYRLQHRLSDFHSALNEVGAIYVSARVHAGWEKSATRSGEIEPRSETLGGHAFAIVGYNSRGFLVQNSWGKTWGKNGVALWLYEDWQENIRDAWVFRLGLPTPQIWHKPPSQYSSKLDDREGLGRSPTRAEIAGHFVHIDDGRFHETGRYWSTLADTRQTAKLIAKSRKYDHLLFYAHGGLNSPKASAGRISAMRDIFKENRIYPYHIMYDTGLLEELKDVVAGKKERAEARVGGFADWFDRVLERITQTPGRALWREMKAGARLPFAEGAAGDDTLQAFLEAFAGVSSPPRIHLAGHSTGAILMAHLAQRLAAMAPELRVASCSLMAPAATVELFRQNYRPLLQQNAGFAIDSMRIYNLNDKLEQDDHVAGVYRKSLLYLVSNSFEEENPAPLLGMKRYNKGLDRALKQRLEFVYSSGAGGNPRTTAKSHGGFDNDAATMNDILRHILDAEPPRPFRSEDLRY
ncbi:MAG: peptidase C1 [Gammaproteobacteria bacterium]|nr:peptidase C1 [Gammaproteobacteria bacterium]